MSSVYPSSILSITNPTAANTLNNPDHAVQHATINDNVTAIENKLGVDNSSVITSIDYLVKNPLSGGGGHIQTPQFGGTGQTMYNKGDILVGQSSSVLGKQAAGTNGYAVIYDSTQTTGLNAAPVLTGTAVQNQSFTYGVASVLSASVYGVTISPAPSVLQAGQSYSFQFPAQNTTSILAISINNTLSAPLLYPDYSHIEVGGIKASMAGVVEYDTNGNFQLVSNPHNVGSVAGNLVQLDSNGNLPVLSGQNLTNLPTPWTKVATASIVSFATLNNSIMTLASFTGLTGDTDDEYLLNFELSALGMGETTNAAIGVRFNNDTAVNYGYNNLQSGVPNGSVVGSSSMLAIATIVNNAQGFDALMGEVTVKASKTIAGTTRLTFSDVSGVVSGSVIGLFTSRGGGTWKDQTSQIIEVDLVFLQNSGGTINANGKATLYKINR